MHIFVDKEKTIAIEIEIDTLIREYENFKSMI